MRENIKKNWSLQRLICLSILIIALLSTTSVRGVGSGIDTRWLQAAKFIKTYEGCRLTAYVCSGGNRTIGYGTSWGYNKPAKISKEQADRLFYYELVQCEQYLNKHITAQLYDYEWVALADHVYNLGSLSPNIINNVNQYNMAEAAKLMSRYVHADGKVIRGLKIRVQARVELFLGQKQVNLEAKGKKDLLCTQSKPLTYLKDLTPR